MRFSYFIFLHIIALALLLIVHPHTRTEDNALTISEGDKGNIYLIKNKDS